MKPEKLTVSYGVKRCADFQSISVDASLEVSLEEGDTPKKAFEAAMKTLTDLVDTEADYAIKALQYRSSTEH